MSEKDVSPFGMPFRVNPKLVGLVIIIILIAGLGMTSFYMVDQSEQAVVLRFGQFARMTGPGLQFKLPLGIERNYNVPVQRVQNMTFGYRTERPGAVSIIYAKGDYPEESVMLTGDLNIVDVEWIIQYRISEPRAWLFNVLYREQTIRDISQSVINQMVGDRTIFDVIGPERTNIEYLAQQEMQRIFDIYELGITMTTVRLQNIVPPKGEVQDAFEDVNKAIQDMNRFINEGKEAYNRDIPRVRGEADQAVQVARGYAAQRVNEARGNVARFNSVYEEYRDSREVTRSRLYIETLEEIFSTDKTDLIDKNLDNFLPLKNLETAGGAR